MTITTTFPVRDNEGSTTFHGQSACSLMCGGPLGAGAVKADPPHRVLAVAEPAGRAFHGLDQPVVALGAGVGDGRAEERVNLRPPGVDGPSQRQQFGDVRIDAPGEEFLEPVTHQVKTPLMFIANSSRRICSFAMYPIRI